MEFYLGTHRPHWLDKTAVPLFVSRRTLGEYVKEPVALGKWALDSGGFSELSLFGRYETSARDYADEAMRWQEKVGGLQWAAIQDWMCEPFMIEKTGLTIREHQRRTTHSYLQLRQIAPEVHWVPVLQGWEPEDYLEHLDEYNRALPFPLERFRMVGVGSICRRQGMQAAMEILRPLHARGLRLHGFGFKVSGLMNGASALLASADSMAWSRAARYEAPLPGCTHKQCNNCIKFALQWRQKVLLAIQSGKANHQPQLFDMQRSGGVVCG